MPTMYVLLIQDDPPRVAVCDSLADAEGYLDAFSQGYEGEDYHLRPRGRIFKFNGASVAFEHKSGDSSDCWGIEVDRKAARESVQKERFVAAECEHCGGKWLLDTDHPPYALDGSFTRPVCLACWNDSDSEKPLTFRTPTKLDIETMVPDEKMTNWVLGITGDGIPY